MKAMKIFNNLEDYEQWTLQFDGCYEYEDVPVMIHDNWGMRMDLMTECKSYKTAVKRFKKVFDNYDPIIPGWTDGFMESYESGYYNVAETSSPEYGIYAYGIEQIDDNRWYVYLNITGGYAKPIEA